MTRVIHPLKPSVSSSGHVTGTRAPVVSHTCTHRGFGWVTVSRVTTMGTEIRIIESKKRVREVSEHHSKMSDPFFLITYNTEQTMDQPFSPFIKYIVPSDETNFTTIQAHFQPQPRKVCIMPKTGWRLHLSCRPVAPGEKTYIIVQNAYRISDTEARGIFLYSQSVLNYERQGQNN